jgi:hypothetical protein
MKLTLFTDADVARRIGTRTHPWSDVVSATRDAGAVRASIAGDKPDLIVLDPDLDFVATGDLARAARRSDILVAVLNSADPMRSEMLWDMQPIGILRRDFDPGDVTALLATARSELELKDAAAFWSFSDWWRRPETFAAFAAMAAFIVGYGLPGGMSLTERDQRNALYLVAGLAFFAFGLLVSARKPLAGGLQFCLIALVTILPTQA